MQCKSYFPAYHSHYDLNVDSNGGATTMYNGNPTFRSGHYNDYVPSSPIPRGPLFAYKELLRQTMLMHEVTFRDQVQELHRVYRKQKELMGEIKSKELYVNQLHSDVQGSNSSSAKVSARCDQNALHGVPFINSNFASSSIGRDNIQTSLSSDKELTERTSPVGSRNGGTFNDRDFAESKGKKIRGKLLDLELPAEAYVDSDEEEFLHPLTPVTLLPNKCSKVVVETDIPPSSAIRSLNPVLQTELPSPCSFTGGITNLADLNEPLEISYLEESGGNKRIDSGLEISESNRDLSNNKNTVPEGAGDKLTLKSPTQSDKEKSEVGSASSGGKFSNMGQNPPVVQALPSVNNPLSSSKGAKIFRRQKGVLNNKVNVRQWCYPNSTVAKSFKNSCFESELRESAMCMSVTTPDLNCIDLNSAAVGKSESRASDSCEVETLKKSKRGRMIDINLPCDPMTDEDPIIQDDIVGHDHKNLGRLDLNFCINDDGLPPKLYSLVESPLKIDSEAPISPEVEEQPPPRGDLEEDNQPEESGDSLLDLAKSAADAIVSISSSQSVSYLGNTDLLKCKAADGGELEWFAGLIYSLSVDVDNDLEMVLCKDTCSIDDFEAMTLQLTEMKVEDYWCKDTVHFSSETCSMLLPCQTRRGRTRRSKRKDFQREVLPSLVSLSRYEVTEDMQMIEGLMEAAGTPWNLSRTRRACRMGRKPRVARQQTIIDEVLELRTLIGWGKVNRRSSGRRSPASPTVLSKWLEYST